MQHTLFDVLTGQNEPNQQLLEIVVRTVIRDPGQISQLVNNQTKDDIVLAIIDSPGRFVRIFELIHKWQVLVTDNVFDLEIADLLAKATTSFLNGVLDGVCETLDAPERLKLLVAAIPVCLTRHAPSELRDLSQALVQHEKLFKSLMCTEHGSQVTKNWVESALLNQERPATLSHWHHHCLELVRTCPGCHENVDLVAECTALTSALTKLSDVHIFTNGPHTNTSTKATMLADLLTDQDLAEQMRSLEIAMPTSERSLAHTMGIMRNDRMTDTLRRLTRTFPCGLCFQTLDNATKPHEQESATLQNIPATSPKSTIMDLFGENSGPWKIRLTPAAFKDIQKYFPRLGGCPGEIYELESGRWSGQLAGNPEQRSSLRVPLTQSTCTGGLILLWQIDIDYGHDPSVAFPIQTIMIWGLGTREEINVLVGRVIIIQFTYTDAYCEACKLTHKENKLFIPRIFKDEGENGNLLVQRENRVRQSKLNVNNNDIATIEMANKFYTLTKPMTKAIALNNLTAEFPFEISPEELAIIDHQDTATLVLGRSGTGKTTCLVFKMVRNYLSCLQQEGIARSRALLLTRSKFLSTKLRQQVRGLVEGQTSRQLTLKSIGSEEEVENEWASSSLKRVSTSVLDLTDDHFPLVCTFMEFIQFLENSIIAFDRQASTPGDGSDAKMVYPEILGVIKGSVSSTSTLLPIALEDYLRLSSRSYPAFPLQSDRERVYAIFEQYEKTKTMRSQQDIVDRVVRIISRVRANMSLRQAVSNAIQEVYVDEVQDHQCIDFALFLAFINDARSIHCAGDTAQAISQDSSFRFSDPKGLFYEHFSTASALTGQRDLSRPKLFALGRNYRSHQGILDLATFVMDLLWKGFPDTIDKLQPEIGFMAGPKPCAFVDLGIETLLKIDEEEIRFSKRSVQFGAEQVFLVRDEIAKEKLEAQLGDAALVLTILQSKGMEFDDVMLWNYFQGTDFANIARKLRLLHDSDNGFDSRKYWMLCAELKNLYVAVTRARMKFVLIEPSEGNSKPFIDILAARHLEDDWPSSRVTERGNDTVRDKCAKTGLKESARKADHGTESFEKLPSRGAIRAQMSKIEVVRRNDADVKEKLFDLLPRGDADPLKWRSNGEQMMQGQNFREAAKCFRKAGMRELEKRALGYLNEQEAKRAAAGGKQSLAQNFYQQAHEHFKDIELYHDAARCLENSGDFEAAAQMCLRVPDYRLAADLYLRMKEPKVTEAIKYVLRDHRFEDAVDILQRFRHYDQLFAIAADNHAKLSTMTMHRISLRSKLLLKGKKVVGSTRLRAIELLGDVEDQEAAMQEYEMTDELLEFYRRHRRYPELFNMQVKALRLYEALDTAVAGNKHASGLTASQQTVTKLLNFVCAKIFYERKDRVSPASAVGKATRSRLDTRQTELFKDWSVVCKLAKRANLEMWRSFATLKTETVRTVMCLQLLFRPSYINDTEHLEGLDTNMLELTIGCVKTLLFDSENERLWDSLLLAFGVWTGANPSLMALLHWSPQHSVLEKSAVKEFRSTIRRWMLDRCSIMIVQLDRKAQVLLNARWPAHCAHFLLNGHCPRRQRQEECIFVHKSITTKECSDTMEDVLQLTALFCNLNAVHSRQVLPDTFQAQYFSIRRYWLEQILRRQTFVTALEQDAALIHRTSERIFGTDEFPSIRQCLEGLLYHRLNRDWKVTDNYSARMEQVQLARMFQRNVQVRHFRSIAEKLHGSRGDAAWYLHLKRLDRLEWEAELCQPAVIRRTLEEFSSDLDLQTLEGLKSFHVLTTIFEELAMYLIFKTSSASLMVPKSWLELYCPRIPASAVQVTALEWSDKHFYREIFTHMIGAFCHLLKRMDLVVRDPPFRFLVSGKKILPAILQRRNVDFLVICIVNLLSSAPTTSQGGQAYRQMQEILLLPSMLSCRLPYRVTKFDDFRNNLHAAFATGNEKNGLVIARKDMHSVAFPTIPRVGQIVETTFRDLQSQMRQERSKGPLKDEVAATGDDRIEQAPENEVLAAQKLQKLWRNVRGRLAARQRWLMTPEAITWSRFIKLGESLPVPDRKRVVLLKGKELQSGLDETRAKYGRVNRVAMQILSSVTDDDHRIENLDKVLRMLQECHSSLKSAEYSMTDEALRKLVTNSDAQTLEDNYNDVSQRTEKVTRILDELSESLTAMRDANISSEVYHKNLQGAK